ncbi:MAG: DUF3794 domain-containing protein [Lachnospiraceae bacterium]|nr:DUF3794 domain-containing protein [Lachnospiraceae bacterium]
MSAEFFKTAVPVGGRAAKISAQTAVSGDIIIPDNMPDVKDVLTVTATPVINDEKVTDGRVSFGGDLKVDILYSSKDEQRPVLSAKGVIPFVDFINADDIKKGDRSDLRFKLLSSRAKVVNDRKVNVRAIGEVSTAVSDGREKNIVCGADGEGVQVLEKSVSVFREGISLREEFEVEDRCIIPSNMPEIDVMLKSEVWVNEYELTPADGRVSARGSLGMSVLYNGRGGLERTTFKIPFGGGSAAEGVKSSSVVWGDVYVKDVKVDVNEDDNGSRREIGVKADIAADINTGDNTDVTAVKDIYSTKGKASVMTESIRFPERGVYTSAANSLREIITINDSFPDIMQIKDVSVTAETDNVEINGDMLDIEGILYVNMLYVTGDDNDPIESVKATLPFENSVEIRGIYDDAETDITVNVRDVDYSLLSGREAEIRLNLDYSIFALMENEEEFVTEAVIDESDPVKTLPGITIYTVRKGDTLWDIAKRFNTTVDEILAINRIEEPDIIYPGQRVLVLKRAYNEKTTL